MSHDPLAPIWTRLDCEPPVFFADRPEPGFSTSRDRLVDLGFVQEIEPAQVAVCLACGGGHVRRVIWYEDSKTGRRAGRIPCPNCGSVPIDPGALGRWSVDVPCLLAAAFRAAGGRVGIDAVVPGHLWFVGSATWLGRSRQAYFARFVHGAPRAAVLAALKPHPRAVLFHPTERAVRMWVGATPNPVVALESVVSLTPAGLAFDAAVVESRLVDAGFGEPKATPPRKREERAAKIEALVRELQQHLRDAHEHAVVTSKTPSGAQLLPRPTQKELAARCGLTETDVSRCLEDPQAKLLQLCWKAAADIAQVLAWDGHVGGNPT